MGDERGVSGGVFIEPPFFGQILKGGFEGLLHLGGLGGGDEILDAHQAAEVGERKRGALIAHP